jgi:hypothetical protein
MKKDDPRNWDEEKIWASILDQSFNFHPVLNADIFKCWENKIGISKKQYVEMNLGSYPGFNEINGVLPDYIDSFILYIRRNRISKYFRFND